MAVNQRNTTENDTGHRLAIHAINGEDPERPIRDEYLIVHKGQLAGTGKHSYTEGNTTKGSEDVAKFKGLEDVNTRPAKLQRVSTGGC
ncbi:unnamed protein product [Symbiodinium microadriaticum]|nr:unnamed protein product [Symbiodinium microadriaticum]